MITCPDCSQTAPDDARFCEQCGRGLHDLPPPAVELPPLAVGKELQGRFKIVAVISQNSVENRYRAVALDNESQRFVLRERIAPAPLDPPEPEPPAEAAVPIQDDPAGPQAKTRDLAPLANAAMPAVQPEPASAPSAGATGSPEDSGVRWGSAGSAANRRRTGPGGLRRVQRVRAGAARQRRSTRRGS